MKIDKIKKLTGNRYKLILDNKAELILYEDVIINYNLLTKKELNYNLIEKINYDNNYYTSYNLALKYINFRLRSVKEIKEYLLKKNIDKTTIEQTINKLNNQGYLNDDKFVKAFINDKLAMTNWGPYKIKRELDNFGIEEEKTDQIINNIDIKILEDKIKKIISKLIIANKNLSNNLLKIKIMSYLISLGYSTDMIKKYIDDIKIDNKKLIEKEYNKIYKKYKDKYDDKQLEYIIKQKLYQKGFDINDLE
jgi:regulatory protein